MNLIRGSRQQNPGRWRKVRIEFWTRGEVLPAVAALVDPAVRRMAELGEPAETVILDGFAVFDDSPGWTPGRIENPSFEVSTDGWVLPPAPPPLCELCRREAPCECGTGSCRCTCGQCLAEDST